jgi:hypothetical protein
VNNISVHNSVSNAEVQTRQQSNSQGGANIEIFVTETIAHNIEKGGRVFKALKTATGSTMTPIVR